MHGNVDHLSLSNTSPRSRHTFQLHLVEDRESSRWRSTNWQQYEPFPRLVRNHSFGTHLRISLRYNEHIAILGVAVLGSSMKARSRTRSQRQSLLSKATHTATSFDFSRSGQLNYH